MTYRIRTENTEADKRDEYDDSLYADPTAPPKRRSRGTQDLMAAFGMAR